MKKTLINTLIVGLLSLLLAGCMDHTNVQDSGRLVLHAHPLVNRIWDVRQQTFIERKELEAQALAAKYLLLGETHDNALHHQYQAEMIAMLARAGNKPSVHFEMINDRQFERVNKKSLSDSATLIAALEKETSGWNYQQMYRGVFDEVLKADLEILPANIDRKVLRTIIKQGRQKIPDSLLQTLDSVRLPEKQQQGMEQEIMEGHCNALPQAMVAPMVLGQQVRDARMGLSLLQSRAQQRVLVCGSGHARKDRGAPLYVQAEDPAGRLLSIGFLEVISDKHHPAEYAARWDGEGLPFDYVWFTPRYDRADPCEGFKEHMKKQ